MAKSYLVVVKIERISITAEAIDKEKIARFAAIIIILYCRFRSGAQLDDPECRVYRSAYGFTVPMAYDGLD